MSGKVVTPGRVGGLSGLMAECGAQAASYGKCVASEVTGKVELQRGACGKEFEELKRCLTKAAKRKTR